MLIQARQAYVAHRYAPVQEKSSIAAMRIRAQFEPDLLMWIDAQFEPQAVGNVVTKTPDLSGKLTVNQTTAAKKPLKTAYQNVPSWQFDGIDDCLVTTSSAWSTSAITILTVRWLTSAVQGFLFERSNDFNFSVTGAVIYGKTTESGLGFKGDVGYTVGSTLYANDAWTCHCAVLDKSKPAASELTAYNNGIALTTTLSLSANNTNDFGTEPNYIGSHANGTGSPTAGYFNAIIVLKRALSDKEAFIISRYAMQRARII